MVLHCHRGLGLKAEPQIVKIRGKWGMRRSGITLTSRSLCLCIVCARKYRSSRPSLGSQLCASYYFFFCLLPACPIIFTKARPFLRLPHFHTVSGYRIKTPLSSFLCVPDPYPAMLSSSTPFYSSYYFGLSFWPYSGSSAIITPYYRTEPVYPSLGARSRGGQAFSGIPSPFFNIFFKLA